MGESPPPQMGEAEFQPSSYSPSASPKAAVTLETRRCSLPLVVVVVVMGDCLFKSRLRARAPLSFRSLTSSLPAQVCLGRGSYG